MSLPLLEKWSERLPDSMGWGWKVTSPWPTEMASGKHLYHWCLAEVWKVLPKSKKLLPHFLKNV